MFEGLRFGDLGLEVLRIERLRFRGFGYGISCEVQGLNSRAHVQDNLGPMFVGLRFMGLRARELPNFTSFPRIVQGVFPAPTPWTIPAVHPSTLYLNNS